MKLFLLIASIVCQCAYAEVPANAAVTGDDSPSTESQAEDECKAVGDSCGHNGKCVAQGASFFCQEHSAATGGEDVKSPDVNVPTGAEKVAVDCASLEFGKMEHCTAANGCRKISETACLPIQTVSACVGFPTFGTSVTFKSREGISKAACGAAQNQQTLEQCVKKCAWQIGCMKSKRRVTSDLGKTCRDVVNPCCSNCVAVLENAECITFNSLKQILEHTVTSAHLDLNGATSKDADGSMVNLFQLRAELEASPHKNPKEFMDKMKPSMFDKGRVSETLETLRESTFMKSLKDKERRSFDYDALKASVLSAQSVDSFYKLDIDDFEGMIGFARLDEVKELPVDLVKRMTKDGFNDAPVGFLQTLHRKGKLNEVTSATFYGMNETKRKEIRKEDFQDFARDHGKEKTLALLCGESDKCPVRDAVNQGRRAIVMDFTFSSSMTWQGKRDHYMKIKKKALEDFPTGTSATVEILEKIPSFTDSGSGGEVRRLRRSLDTQQGSNGIGSDNSDIDFDQVDGIRLQTDATSTTVNDVLKDEIDINNPPTITELGDDTKPDGCSDVVAGFIFYHPGGTFTSGCYTGAVAVGSAAPCAGTFCPGTMTGDGTTTGSTGAGDNSKGPRCGDGCCDNGNDALAKDCPMMGGENPVNCPQDCKQTNDCPCADGTNACACDVFTSGNNNNNNHPTTCTIPEDCGTASAGCGYHCVSGKCALWCNGAAAPNTDTENTGMCEICKSHPQHNCKIDKIGNQDCYTTTQAQCTQNNDIWCGSITDGEAVPTCTGAGEHGPFIRCDTTGCCDSIGSDYCVTKNAEAKTTCQGVGLCGTGAAWNNEQHKCVATYDGILKACRVERKQWAFTCDALVTCTADEKTPSNAADEATTIEVGPTGSQ